MNRRIVAALSVFGMGVLTASAANRWHVSGGTEKFVAFLRTAADAGTEVAVYPDVAGMPWESATSDVFFVIPEYEKDRGELPDFPDALCARAEAALARGCRLYVERPLAHSEPVVRLLGAETYGVKPVSVCQEYLVFDGEILQARQSTYLPAGTRTSDWGDPSSAVVSVSDCLGVRRVSRPGSHRLPVLVSSRRGKVHAAFFGFSDYNPHFMRAYAAWRSFFGKFLERIADADPKRAEAAFRTVYPDFMRDSRGEDVETLVRRAVEWHRKSGVLIAPDGSRGMYEAIASDTFGFRRELRGDCHFLTAALFACAGKRYGRPDWTRIGTSLADFALARGFQTEKGFIRWFDREAPGSAGHTVYSSDMGRSALGLVNLYKATGDKRYLDAARKAAEAFLLWMNGSGLNSGYFQNVDDDGWKDRETSDNPVYYAEMVSFLLQLGEKRYTDAALLTVEKIGERFPDVEPFGFSDNFTYSRYLLMLACAQRTGVRDYSDRINRTLEFFVKNAHRSGGIEETPIRLRDDTEAGVAMGDGSDHVTDLLYCDYVTFNALSVLMKLPRERCRGVDRAAVERLYRGMHAFLRRVQIASDEPKFDGAWMRAYDMDIGEYYGLDKDRDWGCYCIETGWVTGFIPLVFMYEDAQDSFFFR